MDMSIGTRSQRGSNDIILFIMEHDNKYSFSKEDLVRLFNQTHIIYLELLVAGGKTHVRDYLYRTIQLFESKGIDASNILNSPIILNPDTSYVPTDDELSLMAIEIALISPSKLDM